MPRRPQDWFEQAQFDLELARQAHAAGRFEWACFACQQAGEKMVKGLYEAEGAEAWGHSVRRLLEKRGDVPPDVVDAGRRLDRHYIAARYPNAHPEGSPAAAYTGLDAEQALRDAQAVLEYVESRHPQA